MAQHKISINRIVAIILKVIRPKLIKKPDIATLLAQVDEYAAFLTGDKF
jgi:hypothetical protein